MININVLDPLALMSFWLCFCRWASIFMFIPGLSENSVPGVVKVLMCLVVSYAFFPSVESLIRNDILAVGETNFWVLTIYYILSGVVVGFLMKSIFTIFQASGNLMTQQMGFASASTYDPSFQSNVGPLEKIIQWTMIMMILSTGALLPIFKGIVQSFGTLSLHTFTVKTNLYEYLNIFFKDLVRISLLLSAPIVVSTLFMNSALGLISRFIPQMNVFMISFVVNIAFGLFIFYAISTEFFYYAYKVYVNKLGEWFLLIS